MANSLDDILWRLLKQECGLDEQHIQMARRLRVKPEHLAECDHDLLKQHLKIWIERAYGKTFGDDRPKSITTN